MLPAWVLPAACIVSVAFVVVDRAGNFFLRLLIIKGYVQDYRRSDTADYVTMFQDLNDKY